MSCSDATCCPTESFQRLLPYFTFSPLTAETTDEFIMSPNCPGGRIMLSLSDPLNSWLAAALLAWRARDSPIAGRSMSRCVPWNVSIPSPGCSLVVMDVKCP